LNCGPGSADKKSNVLKNLEIVSNKIKPKPKKIVLLNQVHSNKFHYLGKHSKLNNKFEGDALVTDRINTPIAILPADCAPVLFLDER
jgi:copper oxidase (laccase) domain-containing protein